MSFLKNSKWIWLSDESEAFEKVNLYGDFRKEFALNTLNCNDVRLFISADSRYQVFINGVYLPLSQYADFPFYKVYDEVDISAYVSLGINVITIIGYHQGEDSSVYLKGNAGVIFAIYASNSVVVQSDESTLSRKSQDYISGEMERFSPQLSFSFKYDSRKYDDWNLLSYSAEPEKGWKKSQVINQDLPLYPRPVKPLDVLPDCESQIISQGEFIDSLGNDYPSGNRIQKSFMSFRETCELGIDTKNLPIDLLKNDVAFKSDSNNTDGIYFIVDLLKEQAGLFSLDIALDEDSEILVGFGEHLEDLRVRANIGERQFASVYYAKKGRQQFFYHMKRFGCRYLQIHVYTHKFKLFYAGLKPTNYPIKYKPEFHCADNLHNKIFEVSRRTLELCMHEHYEDCPWREQALYAMDSRNQMLCGYYVFDDYEFAEASLRLFALSQREDGLLELCAPAKVRITIPSFSLSFISAVYENLIFSGNKSFALEMVPIMEKIISTFLNRMEENGLVPNFVTSDYWNFYEWQPGLDGDTIFSDEIKEKTFDSPLNGFLSIALRDFSKIYCILDLNEKAEEALSHQTALNHAMQLFWSEEKGLYKTYIGSKKENKINHYAELAQSLLICAGIGDENRNISILEKIKNKTDFEDLIETTLSTTIFKYQAFIKYGDRYGEWVGAEIARIWGHMLYNNATTFWETIKGPWDFDRAGSLCHGWAAIPIYFYYKYGLGISPEEDTAQIYMGFHKPTLIAGEK